MSHPFFQFKQFTVFHDRCAMKVGIDGVTLGAWTPVDNAKKILDIGTGTGLIALMLAQRSTAEIDALDIDKQAIEQARFNVENSAWKNRIRLFETSLQEYHSVCTTAYDVLVCNPPYFINSKKSPIVARNMARHAESLTHEELIDLSFDLLKPDGTLCVILPVEEGLQAISHALASNWYAHQMVFVFPKPAAKAKRLLIQLGKKEKITRISRLAIETEQRHEYTDEYKSLVKNFYLKL
ncbi:MAG TPA: methyltransferase [Paludibacteraceae bacterium]|nr:methyltransferase [Paludibacteraceae bacterium]HOR38341.1 methyltransferase [Paludibacteraceae bacterium]HQG67604.1 methyltransferase [Paludibacteraceae bacterium]HRS23527.1 methyltransferase [Paludibacteraceae bacterium]HRT77720.1 methyltransferase [Paludibacteraceae bacterium]